MPRLRAVPPEEQSRRGGQEKSPSREASHTPSAERKISVRTQGNFCAHAGKFLCARKFISFRKEILPSAEGGLSPYTISN